MDIKPIETAYNGYRFRSRLEARWAVFFDALGVEYQYEPEGYDLGEAGYYLPDFYLPKFNAFIEIKGQMVDDSSDEVLKIHTLGEKKECIAILFVGLPASIPVYPYTNFTGFHVALAPDQEIAINRLFLSGSEPYYVDDDWGKQIVCPICGFEYVHFLAAETDYGDDVMGSAWQGRGMAVKVPMWCECGHSWTLRLGFHKGQTFVAIENCGYNNENFLAYINENSPGLLIEACEKASQARFEHGENGGN